MNEYPTIKINQGFIELNGEKLNTVLALDAHYESGKAGLAEVTMKIHAKTDIEGTADVKKIQSKSMNYGQALELLKQGEKVARSGWNGKGMWIEYVKGIDYSFQ